MNDLQKRFEAENLQKAYCTVKDEIGVESKHANPEYVDMLLDIIKDLTDQLTWRSVEKLPEYELDIDGICNELAIVKYNCGDDDNYAVATYEWINQNFVEVEYWLPIPKLDGEKS